MKTFLAHLADKPSDTPLLRGVKRWLLMRQDVLRYGMAPLAVAIAFVARMALTPIVQGDSPYLFFIPAVLVAAGLGGLGPGLLATGLSAVLGLFVITDFPNLTVPEVVNAVAFVLIGAGMAWGGEQLQRNRVQAAISANDAHARAAHLTSILDTVPDAMIVIDERRNHPFFQLGGRAAVRLCPGGSHRDEYQAPDADSLPGEPRWLPRALPPDRRAADHRDRAARGRRAQGRLDFSDGAGRGRNALEQSALLHRIHPRPYGAAADRGKAPGIAVRARAYLPIDRHGRDGVRTGSRAQPAAVRDRQLHERLATHARSRHRRPLRLAARCHGQGGGAGFTRGSDHPPLARFRGARRERAPGRKRQEACRGSERVGPRRRQGSRRSGAFSVRSHHRPRPRRQGADSAGSAQPAAQRRRGHGILAKARARYFHRAPTRMACSLSASRTPARGFRRT